MKNNQLMIYGAYGYAGELMVREAVAQGLRPIIAGRDDEKLKPIATELSLECRAFGVRNTGSNLQDISVLLNCAGPFSATAETLARACLAQQIHYLDITGEIDIFRKCHALDEEARQQNVLILPGAGTDIVPTDCLAAMLKEKLPVATRIDLALSFGTNPSIGTVNTMIESFGKGGLIREGGMLKVVSNAFQMRKIPFQNKPQWAMTIPWGDVFTSGISTGVPDGAVYMAMPRMSIYMIRLTNPVKGILNTQFGQKITKRLAGWLMKKGLTPKRWRPGGDNSGARPRLRTAKSWK
ncbi:MAG: saccharopine dehydrogenase family protein [Alistipes onderdonkii]